MQEWLDRLNALDWEIWSGPAIIALRVTLVAVVAWLAAAVLGRMIRVFRYRITRQLTDREQIKRAETIARVLLYIVSVTLSLIAAVVILSELGVAVAPILGAAGVVGLAIGFGAQSLVKDYFTGFFLILENQLTTGDVVSVGGKSGLVEDVTLRFVRLRDYEGNVHFVPNNLITTVTNMSRGFAQAVMEISIAYRENVDEAFEVMREVGRDLRSHPSFEAKILEELEIAGIERWDDSRVVLRCRFKVLPLEQWGVRREFLRRLKLAFEARDIEIPYPHLTVYAGAGKDGQAAPFHIRNTPADAGTEGVS